MSSKPSFQGGLIRHCSEDLIPKWLRLNEIVASGKPAQSGVWGIAIAQSDAQLVSPLWIGLTCFRSLVGEWPSLD